MTWNNLNRELTANNSRKHFEMLSISEQTYLSWKGNHW